MYYFFMMSFGEGFNGVEQFCLSSTCPVDNCLKKGMLENLKKHLVLLHYFLCYY